MKNQYSKYKTENGESKHSSRQVFLIANGFTGKSTDTFFSTRKFDKNTPAKNKVKAMRKTGRRQRVINRRNS